VLGRAQAAVVALVAVAAGCGSAHTDKAGGKRGGERTLVLGLEQSDPTYAGREFAAAVAQRSGGSIRIDVSPARHYDRLEFERGIVEDVRAGRSELGVVGARVWDTLGVTSFQPLVAPFLVDSLQLEQRILESPLAARMLVGVDRSGVVGLALLPGPLRRPFGYRRPLVRREEYERFRIGVHPGRVEEATLRALGATTRKYLSLGGASREGAVLNLWAISDDAGYRGKTLASNVVFWPRPETVVMNRRAFDALTSAQQAILRDAGRQAVGRRLAAVQRLENDALLSICERRLASLVAVQPADVSALHAAVRPVYAELERSPRIREAMAEIRRVRAGQTPAPPLVCPAAAGSGARELEGVWGSSVSSGALLAAGASKAEAATYEGHGTLELKDGRWVFRGDHTTVTGRYTVEGDVIRLTMRTCTANPCSPGAVSEYVWSAYRDRLSFMPRPGLSFWPRLVAGRAVRIR
jgi:TRAP-type C4-dicarboxylate transport system substrate-binding protein